MGLSKDIGIKATGNGERLPVECSGLVLAHIAFPATAIDIAHDATLNVGIGTGHEAGTVPAGIVTRFCSILNGAARTGGIDVFLHCAAKQGNIGGARHHGIRTEPTAVCIVVHRGSTVDDDIGVIPVLY